MQPSTYQLPVNLPSEDDFAAQYPQYGPLARGELGFLFKVVVSPDGFANARVATTALDLPAVAGVAKRCYEAVQGQTVVSWTPLVKQFIGAAVSTLMQANGFHKTGQKKAIPHPMFTKGEVYRL